MSRLFNWFYLLALIMSPIISYSQDVSYSKELNIRSDFYYDILGLIDDHIVMLRDRGFNHELEVFERDLSFKWSRQLNFEKRKVNIIHTLPRDTSLLVFYQYEDDDQTFLVADHFEISAELIRTDTLLIDQKSSVPRYPSFYISENQDYGAFFSKSYKVDDALSLTLIRIDSLNVIWDEYITLKGLSIQKHFKGMLLTNEGDIILLFEKNNKNRKKDEHLFNVIHLPKDSEEINRYTVDMSEVLSSTVQFSYDNRNKKILITGLYNNKNTQDALGYYYISSRLNKLEKNQKPNHVPFTDNFIAEVYGTKKGKEKVLENFVLKDATFREDGGFLIVAEMNKEFSRRSNYGTANSFRGAGGFARGWTDYYNEEVILINVNPNGEELWKKVLYKKQFSQDDDGVFSSFFMCTTPNRMRILFNDEIKKNSTASEYVINPVGDYKRHSILSTEYQKLKLRFKDAMQISGNEILVPSENNGKLRIVKIHYEE